MSTQVKANDIVISFVARDVAAKVNVVTTGSGKDITNEMLATFKIPRTLFTLDEIWGIVSTNHLMDENDTLLVEDGFPTLWDGKMYPAKIYECTNGVWELKETVSRTRSKV